MKKSIVFGLIAVILVSSAVFAEELQSDESLFEINPRYQVTWPVSSRVITSPFGWRNIFGQEDFHLGVDVAEPEGAPVKATAGGKIVFAGWHESYGNVIYLNSNIYVFSGDIPEPLSNVTRDYTVMRQSRYAHLSAFNVGENQVVNRAQIIGYVGNTGISTGSHLHFEMRYISNLEQVRPLDSTAHNPLIYFRNENFVMLGLTDRLGNFYYYHDLIHMSPESIAELDISEEEIRNFLNHNAVRSLSLVNFEELRNKLSR